MISRISAKLAAVIFLTVVILFALLAVGITINSRAGYRQEAIQSIAQSYAGPQTLVGPVLSQTRIEDSSSTRIDAKGVAVVDHGSRELTRRILPKASNFQGELIPSERHHGLYGVTVYELRAAMDEDFGALPVTDQTVRTHLNVALTDVRGLIGLPKIQVNGAPVSLHLGVSADSGNGTQRSVLTADLPPLTGSVRVHMDIVLGGTMQLAIAPVADLTHVKLTSQWRWPLFAGRFLPRTRTIGPSGFSAEWEIPGLATLAQQQVEASLTGAVDSLDVSLIQPSDPYKLSDRAVKYGVLFVILTFGGFFVFETVKQLPIHPVQYLLVGSALALFFLLLISFSEHMAFGVAYFIGSAASIGLLGFYLSYVLRSARRGAAFAGMISVLFAAIYGLLLSEDNALLLGSLLLFGFLAAIMIITRRVDWYALSGTPTELQRKIQERNATKAAAPWSKGESNPTLL